jgi:putative ABC transport system ATP-binding protein
MNMNNAFLQLESLNKAYKTGQEEVHALQGVNLRIEKEEFVAIMGPSGSGKSTLLSVIGGLSHPNSGRVMVDEIDIFTLSTEKLADFRREYLGFVFQSFNLIPYLTVAENVMLPLAATSFTNPEQLSMAGSILERVGLSTKARRLPDELSGGEQQRVAVARALINQPPIILADEPTGNLDTTTSGEIMKLLRGLNVDGHTVLMVTHNPENLRYADRCVHLMDGQVQNSSPN